MTLFKAPLAFERKDAAFRGAGAFGVPRSNGASEEAFELPSKTTRIKKQTAFASSAPLVVPPVALPNFLPPVPPTYVEDYSTLKKSMAELEKDLAALRIQASPESFGSLWKQKVSTRESFSSNTASAGVQHHAANAMRESRAIQKHIKAIQQMRAAEEEEKRRAVLERAAEEKQKAAQLAKGKDELKKRLEQEKALAAARKPESSSASSEPTVIGPYEQNPDNYEKQVTSDRAKGIMQEAQKIFASVDLINSSQDAKVKKRRSELRMEINRRVGQISNAGNQVLLVIKELLNLSTAVWQGEGNDMLHYCVYTIASKFIDQAQTQITSHPPSAFPYGQAATDIIGMIPSFKTVLMALLFKKCPYIVPRYPPRKDGQSDEEYRLALGYMEGEADTPYTERMCGLVAFYAAIIQCQPLRLEKSSPYDLKFAWLWLASLMNMPPRPITPFIVVSFLENAGFRMLRAFGLNFMSLMQYIQNTFLPQCPAVSVSAKTRLKIFVEGVLKTGKVAEPEGLYIEGINYDIIEAARHKLATGEAPPSRAPSENPYPPRRGSVFEEEQSLPPRPPVPGRPVFTPLQPKGSKKKGGRK